eukprot:1156235-Pelagomonas_calceolata.AAC.20
MWGMRDLTYDWMCKQAAHPTPAQRMKMTGPKGSVSARTRRTAPMATFYENGGGVGGLSGAASDSWAHVSSMGDLEALDTILDTLVRGEPVVGSQ